jgi:heat shock protein HtpX
MSNQIRTTFLLGLMTVFIVLAGNVLGGRQGMIIALIFAGGMNFFSYWYSDKMVLKMYRAVEASPQQVPQLYSMVEKLTQQANLPMPKIYIIPNDAPNAFATGRNPDNAVVAVTEGLLRIMNPEEIMGVLAHELGHVKNRDILIQTIAATMAGAVMMLATMARWSAIFGFGGRSDDEGGGNIIVLLAMSILAPLAAALIQMAISRSREYQADATGARFMGSPDGLADALEKLGTYSRRTPMKASPATAHMFIVNPLSGQRLAGLFSTHPPLEDRIARLRGIKTGPAASRSRSSAADNSGIEQGKAFWDNLSRH